MSSNWRIMFTINACIAPSEMASLLLPIISLNPTATRQSRSGWPRFQAKDGKEPVTQGGREIDRHPAFHGHSVALFVLNAMINGFDPGFRGSTPSHVTQMR